MSELSHLDLCVALLVETFMKYACKDGDAKSLSRSEMRELLQNELPSTLGKADKAKADEMFKTLDADKDGVVSFSEFVATVGAMAELCHAHFTEMMEQAKCQMPA